MNSELTAQPESISLDFTEHSGEVLRRLRTSLAELIKTLPGRVRSTGDLQKLLNVDSKLCWQVMKVAGPGDAMALATFVPTPVPMKRLVRAAANKGVSPSLVEELMSAYRAFEELVSTHAGDRSTFDSMASGATATTGAGDDDLQPTALAHRKATFKAHCHYCGMQLDTSMVVAMIHPSAGNTGRFDLANLRGKLGMRRLRANADVIVDRFKSVESANVDGDKDVHEHLYFDPEAFARCGAPVMARFSTDPLPQFNTVHDKDGRSFSSLAGDAVGQLSSVDLVFGEMMPNVPLMKATESRYGFGGAIGVGCPTMLSVVDHVIHRASFRDLEYRFSTHWQTTTADFSGNTRGPVLPFRDRINKVEGGLDGARLLEVPNYLELLQFVCDERGWNVDDFDVYRARVEYPLFFSRLWIDFLATPT
jgi:hypothetical protein